MLESSLHRGPGSSIRLHLLGAYHRSFAAVIRGQFQNKAEGEDSREALRMLVEEKFVRVRPKALVLDSNVMWPEGLLGRDPVVVGSGLVRVLCEPAGQ